MIKKDKNMAKNSGFVNKLNKIHQQSSTPTDDKSSGQQSSTRMKMSRQNRAKQFAPFDALKGLSSALRQKELEHENELKKRVRHEKLEDET
jgi:hypothetical protein